MGDWRTMFYLMGDIHGSAREFICRADRIGLEVGDVVLCLGDVGLKYGTWVSGNLRQAMKRSPATFLIMRGNHDVRYCRELENGTFGKGLEPEEGTGSSRHTVKDNWGGIDVFIDTAYPNILYLPDEGGIFTYAGKRCLVIPGAFSVDGDYRRRMGWPYEPDELLTAAEMDALLSLAKEGPVDYVFSHTAPARWEPYLEYLFMDGIDQSRVDKSMENRMDEVLDAVRGTCKGWYFGHFHDDNDLPGGMGHMLYREVVAISGLR